MTLGLQKSIVACTSVFILFSCIVGVSYAQELEAPSATGTPEAIALETDSAVADTYPREALPSVEVYNDFVVGPGRFALEIAPGESKTVEVVVSNRMGQRKQFSFGIEDMQGSNDPSQGVVLLGDETGPYSLREYIQIPHTEFELDHGERVRVPVTIRLPQTAEPGGRYATLLVSIVSKNTDESSVEGARPGSVVISRIGTLFFVTTPGIETHESLLASFSTKAQKYFYTAGPIDLALVTENKGSVHTIPYGEVRIYNMLGHEVGFIELEPWFVMPKSLRLREVSWSREMLLGRYKAVAQVNRGYNDIVDTKEITFWVIPFTFIGASALVLFIFFFILHFILSRFEFKRKER